MNVKRLTQKSLFKTLHPRQNSSSEGVYFVYITFRSASYDKKIKLPANLSVTLYNPLISNNLFKSHWATSVQFLRAYTNLGTKPELRSVGK